MNTIICVAFAMDEQHICEYVGANSHNAGQCECGNTEEGYVLPKPDTNLDYWLYEVVSQSPYTQPDGDRFYSLRFNASEGWYINSKYPPLSDNNGEPILDSYGDLQAPECCVEYYIRTYPTFNKHVGRIIITDPEVYFDGISLKSSFDEFEAYAIRNGLQIRDVYADKVVAQTGYCRIEFSNEKIDMYYSTSYYSNELDIIGPCFGDETVTVWHRLFRNPQLIALILMPIVILIIFIGIKKRRSKIEYIICPVCKTKISNDAIEGPEKTCPHCKQTITKLKEKSSKLFVLQTMVNIFSTLIFVVSMFIVTFSFMSLEESMLIILVGAISLVVGKSICLKLARLSCYYKCHCCGNKHVPQFKDVCFSLHLPKNKRIKCKSCGTKTIHAKILMHDDIQ